MRIKANRLGRGARRSKAPESVISEEPIRLAQALGWILFIGSPFIIILSIWADIDHHSKLEERLEWANAFTEISQVSARAELVADKKSLLYQLLYHVVASQHKAKINYLDPSTQESIPVLGRYAQDENTLKFPSGISVNAWKDTRAQAEFERRIGIATSSVGNSLIENADVDSICTAISNGITIAFGEELTKELGYQICAISKFLSGISSPGSWERSAWIVRCETSLDGNENAWEVDVKYQRGGGNGTVGSLIGISACKASPWPAGNSDEDMWTNQEAVWPEHFTSYDNDWPDIGFLSHSVPETVRWSPRMELAVLERELASAVSTAEQIQRVGEAKAQILRRLTEVQKDLEVSVSGVNLPAGKIVIILGASWGYLGLLYFSIRYRIRCIDHRLDRPVALSAPQFGSPIDPTCDTRPTSQNLLENAPRAIWILSLVLPAFVGWLAFVRFQPIDFLGRMGNSTDLLGLTRSIHSPLYGLYSRDSSLFGFLADVFMLLGVTFYFAAIGLITKPHAEFLLVEKLTPAKLVQSVLCSGLATLSVYLALRICSVKPPAVLAIVIISLATFAALDTWSQIVRLRFRLYLLALFIIFLIVAIPLQTATYWQLNSGVYSAWSVMLLLFMQVGVSRFCSLRGGRVSVILCNSMSGVLLCLLGFEVVRSMIS